YERDLFPEVMNAVLDQLITSESVDLFPIAETLSVVLAARRAGVDHDGSLEQLRMLVRHVDAFSQGAAILDARDPDAVRALVKAAYAEFDERFIRPSWRRRAELIQATAELSHDILTVLLLHRGEPDLELRDDGRVLREVATYLQGGTHTSAQTLVNSLDIIFERSDFDTVLERIASDLLFTQRVVQETLRLRPTTPKAKRRAEADTTVA